MQGKAASDLQGFYLTTDREFALRWASEDSFVNVYELDLTGVEVRRFARNAEWFDYIFKNRSGYKAFCFPEAYKKQVPAFFKARLHSDTRKGVPWLRAV